jgi:multidrug efflux pump subunit AcrB
VPYPGAAPRTVEREVGDVLEEGFTSITGSKRITSTSRSHERREPARTR